MELKTDPQKAETKLDPQGVVIKQDIPNKTTKDLYLAAAFHAEGCRLLGIDRTDPKRMVFSFAGGELPDRVEKEWYAGIAVGSYSVYAASLRTCKSLIHS